MNRYRLDRARGILAGAVLASIVAQPATAQKLEESVILAMPGGTVQDVVGKCIHEKFTPATNVRVEIVSIQPQPALARLLAQRNEPAFDVVYGNATSDYSGFKEGVFVASDPAKLPNLAKVDPRFTTEKDRGTIVTSAILGVQYNTEIFQKNGWAPPKSWKDLWDPKYKGHVGIYGLSIATGQATLGVAGLLNGGDPKNFDAAFQKMAELKPNLYTIFSQVAQYDAAVVDGTVWLGATFGGRPLALMEQGAPVSFAQMEEGTVISNISLTIVKDAPHPEASHALVNWMLSPEAQSCWLDAGYPPVISGVSIPERLVPFMTIQHDLIQHDWGYFQERLPQLLDRWNREIEG